MKTEAYYYLTPTKNVSSILRKGLVAGKSRGLTEHLYEHPLSTEHYREEKGSGLYFTDDLESMGELVGIMSNLAKKPKSFTILEVYLPHGGLVEPDERRFGGGAGALGGFLRSTIRRIPPSCISVVGSVVVRPKYEPTYNLSTATEEAIKLGMQSSELTGYINPEIVVDKEDLEKITEEIRKLPKESRAHPILNERLETIEKYGDLYERKA